MPRMNRAPLRIAVATMPAGPDPRRNAELTCSLLGAAKDAQADVVHFAEGSLSGYAKSEIRDWADVDWDAIGDAMVQVQDCASSLGIHAVVGCATRNEDGKRPFNSLYVLSGSDAGAILARYDKRFCSHTEITSWYSAGREPGMIEVGGWRLGLALCIEVSFPEVFSEYERLDADCVLLSSYSSNPMDWIQAQGHAACNNIWISVSTPEHCMNGLAGGLIGPDGNVLARAGPGAGLCIGIIDESDPKLDVALNKARPWRRLARSGNLYGRR